MNTLCWHKGVHKWTFYRVLAPQKRSVCNNNATANVAVCIKGSSDKKISTQKDRKHNPVDVRQLTNVENTSFDGVD